MGKALDQLTTMLQGTGDLSARVRATLSDFRAGAQAVRRTADTFNRTSRDLGGLAEVGQRELRHWSKNTVPESIACWWKPTNWWWSHGGWPNCWNRTRVPCWLGKPSGRPGPGEK